MDMEYLKYFMGYFIQIGGIFLLVFSLLLNIYLLRQYLIPSKFVQIVKRYWKISLVYSFLFVVSFIIYLSYPNWLLTFIHENFPSLGYNYSPPWIEYIYSHLVGLPITAITFLLVSWSVKFKRNRDVTKRQKTTAIVVLVVVVGHFLMMLMGSNFTCTTSMLGLYIVLDIYFKPVRGGSKAKLASI